MFKKFLFYPFKYAQFSTTPELANSQALTIAYCFFRQGNYERALTKIRSIGAQQSLDIKVLKLYSKILVGLEEFDEAMQVLNKIVDIEPGDIESNVSLMGLMENLSDNASASDLEKITDRITQNHNEEEGQQIAVALTSLLENEYLGIINVLTTPSAFQNEQDRFLAYAVLKEAYLKLNQQTKAIDILEEATQSCPSYLDDIYFELAKLYNLQSNSKQELRSLEKSLQSNESQIDVLVELAWIYFTKGDKQKAEEYLERVEQLENSYAKSLFYKAKMIQSENNLEAAEKLLLKIIKTEGNNTSPQIYNQLGVLYLQKQEIPQAQKYFYQALEGNNEEAQFYFNIALTYKLLNNNYSALDYYEKGLIIQPNNKNALAMKGKILLSSGKTDQAVLALQEAVSLDPQLKDTNLLFDLASALKASNDKEGAAQVLKRIFTLDPSHSKAKELQVSLGI